MVWIANIDDQVKGIYLHKDVDNKDTTYRRHSLFWFHKS